MLLYNNQGIPQGNDYRVNDDIGSSIQKNCVTAIDENGNCIITWQDKRNGNFYIYAQRYDITWNAISRVDHISEEILYWMRIAGCIQISYGVESGSEKVRKFLQKNITSEKIQSAFGLTQKYGIMARAYFIYGAPEESWQTIQETIDLINTIKPLSTIFYILDIFPGTTLYEDFKKRLNATDDIWLNPIEDIMYFETDPDLTREIILAFGQKLRSSFFENLPAYVEAIHLIDSADLYPD